jgi:uncharacterized protein with GYD domain
MATYIILGNYTQQGMDKIRGAPARIDTAREVMHNLGAELKQWYLVMGEYDFVLVVEAPNDETLARLVLAMGSHGNIRTRSMRAFTEQEFRQIVTDLPY